MAAAVSRWLSSVARITRLIAEPVTLFASRPPRCASHNKQEVLIVLAALTLSLHVNAFLCDSSQHAMQFVAAIAQGASDEVAKDNVGRIAKREVCGLYRGDAAIAQEQIVLDGGIAFKVTKFRFLGDNRLAWLAERAFAPTDVVAEQHI